MIYIFLLLSLHGRVDVDYFLFLFYFSFCMISFFFQFNDFLNSLVVVAVLVLEVKQGQESPQEGWLRYHPMIILSRA